MLALFGAVQLGLATIGLGKVARLCTCSTVQITTLCDLPFQIDGEPWLQKEGETQVSRLGQASLLKRAAPPATQLVPSARVLELLRRREGDGLINRMQCEALSREVASL